MQNLKTIGKGIGLALLAVLILIAAFYFIFLDLIVDFWWFKSLNFETYFWLRVFYKYLISGGVTLIFFAIFLFHFWIASRYLGLNPPDDTVSSPGRTDRFQRFAHRFMTGSAIIYTPVSLALAVFIAIPFYQQWEMSLLYLFGGDSGVREAIYGNDVSFYLLSYPVYILVQQELLTSSVLALLMVALLYWLENIYVPNQKREFPLGAKLHLAFLVILVAAFVVWGFLLDRLSLLYANVNEPVFFGPGFIEMRYRLPLIWLSILLFLAMAAAALLFLFSGQHRSPAPFYISLAAFLLVLWLPKFQVIPGLIQRFIVNPNPVKTNRPFIQSNIDSTLKAYGLTNITTVDVNVQLDATRDVETWASQKRFENIPVWDREFLIDSYRQLQEIRPYYHINSIDEDRYFILGHVRQVNLAAREVNLSRLPLEAQNWENLHLRYTHGYGAVVTSAAQDAGAPIIWYLRDLALHSNVGFKVRHPEIYYGEDDYQYAIAPNKLTIPGLVDSDMDIGKPFTGKGGILFNSFFRKALLAIYLKNERIFFSPNITSQSKLKIRRNITERINTLAPFLQLDKNPYLVITEDRLYWVQDAYTTSHFYPVSKPAEADFKAGHEKFNYIRNSVKIIVDAFDGDMDFYIADPTDPIIDAYSRGYPGLFKPLTDLPAELRDHLRYPRDLYYLQMKIYAKYHQQDAALFFQQAETWQFASVRGKEILPYYQTMDFGNCSNAEEFVMIQAMTPVNRSNLSIVGIAGILDKATCGAGYKPGITVYRMGKDTQVNGPAQVEALINQDPTIAQQFTLWDQSGSRVGLGRMIILPMGNSILYVQPVYLMSTGTRMPELTRVIVAIGNEVIMERTLWQAFENIKGIFARNAVNRSGIQTQQSSRNPSAQ